MLGNDKALLVVDVQNDFCPSGALAIKDGDKVVGPINKLMPLFRRIYCSRDWHPEHTRHFKEFGGKWPPHCIRNTEGAKFHPDLRIPMRARIISKGMGNKDDGYSMFEGSYLREKDWPLSFDRLLNGVETIYVTGLATDYCVRATVIDALNLESVKTVYLITDALRAVDLKPGDGASAINSLVNADHNLPESKLKFITTDEILQGLS